MLWQEVHEIGQYLAILRSMRPMLANLMNFLDGLLGTATSFS